MSEPVGSDTPVFSWNPRRPIRWSSGRRKRRFALGSRLNNFGDLLGPIIASRVLGRSAVRVETSAVRSERVLLSVGSILHFARNDDVVWGSGRNGRNPVSQYSFERLDVRAVRGPLTQEFLERQFGISVPAVYGDPALLTPVLFPEIRSEDCAGVVIVPNFSDLRAVKSEVRRAHLPVQVLSPTGDPFRIVRQIANASFVAGSSLHAIVIADAYGVPARLVRSQTEDPFKYSDYFLGSGRKLPEIAGSVAEALRLGAHQKLQWDPYQLLASFPFELWEPVDRGAA